MQRGEPGAQLEPQPRAAELPERSGGADGRQRCLRPDPSGEANRPVPLEPLARSDLDRRGLHDPRRRAALPQTLPGAAGGGRSAGDVALPPAGRQEQREPYDGDVPARDGAAHRRLLGAAPLGPGRQSLVPDAEGGRAVPVSRGPADEHPVVARMPWSLGKLRLYASTVKQRLVAP